MKVLKLLSHLYDESHISAVALDSALHVLNPPTTELKYLWNYSPKIKSVVRVCPADPRRKLIGDETLDSGLLALRSPIENMDVEKPSKDLDEDVTKDESYDEPWCMPGLHKKADERKHVKK